MLKVGHPLYLLMPKLGQNSMQPIITKWLEFIHNQSDIFRWQDRRCLAFLYIMIVQTASQNGATMGNNC